MSKNASVSLGERLTRFAEAQVGQGRYGNASDVMPTGMRPPEEHEENGISSRNVADIWTSVKKEAPGISNG